MKHQALVHRSSSLETSCSCTQGRT
uniref:Uncharacterized protein n=1 Tax=Arundo donax TaxID=35708 RepID=A0A0A9EC50_ARUDO